MLPTVPEPRAEDPEDVSWALSTAEAMWARGEHAEGIKWVRRAAEAASEAEDDVRALELAKSAADLTSLIARRTSRASIDLEEVEPMSEPAPPPVPRAPPPRAPRPTTAEVPSVRSVGPSSITKQVSTPSRPPAPLPSRTSQRPPASMGRPLGTNTGRPPSARPASAAAPPSGERSLGELARAAGIIGSANGIPAENPSEPNFRDTPSTDEIDAGFQSTPMRIAAADPTFVGRVENVAGEPRVLAGSAAEWDMAATQNLTGDELPHGFLPASEDPMADLRPAPPEPASSGRLTDDGDRKTAIAEPISAFDPSLASRVDLSAPTDIVFAQTAASPSLAQLTGGARTTSGSSPPSTVAAALLATGLHAVVDPRAVAAVASSINTRPLEPHDSGIITSQAVRVVVWRDGNGVHVAPAGTVVSAITVDAVLVVLEPHIDLTAWLSPKTR